MCVKSYEVYRQYFNDFTIQNCRNDYGRNYKQTLKFQLFYKPLSTLNFKILQNYEITFFIIKPTRCTNFTNLFFNEILHVSDSSSVHHQEFIHCTLSNGICHTGLQTAVEQEHMQNVGISLRDVIILIRYCRTCTFSETDS